MHNISLNPNSCQPHPLNDHFKVTLLEIAIFNNPNGVMQVLKLANLRLKEISKPPYFTLEVTS
jgi:hypothetical protein